MSKSASAKKTKVASKKRLRCPEPLPVQLIAIEKIDLSPLNRDARNIDDLVASVREHGIQQPTAFLVARAIPPDMQDQALAEFREIFVDREEGAAFPAQDLACHIEQNYLTRLERAPFSLRDAKLVPQAGPCSACPKRSGNQPALFHDDTPKDTCTDGNCFRETLAAHRRKLADDVRIVATAEACPAEDATFASLIFDAMAQGGYHDAIGDTVKRRRLDRPKGEAPGTTLAAHARSWTPRASAPSCSSWP